MTTADHPNIASFCAPNDTSQPGNRMPRLSPSPCHHQASHSTSGAIANSNANRPIATRRDFGELTVADPFALWNGA